MGDRGGREMAGPGEAGEKRQKVGDSAATDAKDLDRERDRRRVYGYKSRQQYVFLNYEREILLLNASATHSSSPS